jgi:hypothetical protein
MRQKSDSMATFRRPVESCGCDIAFIDEAIGDFLGANPDQEVYRSNIPRTGWLAFEHHSLGNVEFPNAELALNFQDSRGGRPCDPASANVLRERRLYCGYRYEWRQFVKHEYHEGPKAREAFDKGMAKLFHVPKAAVKERPKRKPKHKKTSKD